ncbi:MAG: hypothetical protein ACFCU3_09690 [Verrucomicrobiales bacterium]
MIARKASLFHGSQFAIPDGAEKTIRDLPESRGQEGLLREVMIELRRFWARGLAVSTLTPAH